MKEKLLENNRQCHHANVLLYTLFQKTKDIQSLNNPPFLLPQWFVSLLAIANDPGKNEDKLHNLKVELNSLFKEEHLQEAWLELSYLGLLLTVAINDEYFEENTTLLDFFSEIEENNHQESIALWFIPIKPFEPVVKKFDSLKYEISTRANIQDQQQALEEVFSVFDKIIKYKFLPSDLPLNEVNALLEERESQLAVIKSSPLIKENLVAFLPLFHYAAGSLNYWHAIYLVNQILSCSTVAPEPSLEDFQNALDFLKKYILRKQQIKNQQFQDEEMNRLLLSQEQNLMDRINQLLEFSKHSKQADLKQQSLLEQLKKNILRLQGSLLNTPVLEKIKLLLSKNTFNKIISQSFHIEMEAEITFLIQNPKVSLIDGSEIDTIKEIIARFYTQFFCLKETRLSMTESYLVRKKLYQYFSDFLLYYFSNLGGTFQTSVKEIQELWEFATLSIEQERLQYEHYCQEEKEHTKSWEKIKPPKSKSKKKKSLASSAAAQTKEELEEKEEPQDLVLEAKFKPKEDRNADQNLGSHALIEASRNKNYSQAIEICNQLMEEAQIKEDNERLCFILIEKAYARILSIHQDGTYKSKDYQQIEAIHLLAKNEICQANEILEKLQQEGILHPSKLYNFKLNLSLVKKSIEGSLYALENQAYNAYLKLEQSRQDAIWRLGEERWKNPKNAHLSPKTLLYRASVSYLKEMKIIKQRICSQLISAEAEIMSKTKLNQNWSMDKLTLFSSFQKQGTLLLTGSAATAMVLEEQGLPFIINDLDFACNLSPKEICALLDDSKLHSVLDPKSILSNPDLPNVVQAIFLENQKSLDVFSFPDLNPESLDAYCKNHCLFTMTALFIDQDHTVYDPTGKGIQDAINKILRLVDFNKVSDPIVILTILQKVLRNKLYVEPKLQLWIQQHGQETLQQPSLTRKQQLHIARKIKSIKQEASQGKELMLQNIAQHFNLSASFPPLFNMPAPNIFQGNLKKTGSVKPKIPKKTSFQF